MTLTHCFYWSSLSRHWQEGELLGSLGGWVTALVEQEWIGLRLVQCYPWWKCLISCIKVQYEAKERGENMPTKHQLVSWANCCTCDLLRPLTGGSGKRKQCEALHVSSHVGMRAGFLLENKWFIRHDVRHISDKCNTMKSFVALHLLALMKSDKNSGAKN